MLYLKPLPIGNLLNPLTPMPPVNTRVEPWPLFHFWHHHLWPKLASSILNFWRRKRPFQWYPDESDRLSGAWNMQKNAQKFEWKMQSKISCCYTWLLHGKNCSSWWCFLRSFWMGSKPSSRSITAVKSEERRKKEDRQKKIRKRCRSLFRGPISKFWFLHIPNQKCRKTQC